MDFCFEIQCKLFIYFELSKPKSGIEWHVLACSIYLCVHVHGWLAGIVSCNNIALEKYADFIAGNRMNGMFGMSLDFSQCVLSSDMSGGM